MIALFVGMIHWKMEIHSVKKAESDKDFDEVWNFGKL